MKLKVKINYPDNLEELINKAENLMADILVNKLQPKEVEELIKVLQDDNSNISW